MLRNGRTWGLLEIGSQASKASAEVQSGPAEGGVEEVVVLADGGGGGSEPVGREAKGDERPSCLVAREFLFEPGDGRNISGNKWKSFNHRYFGLSRIGQLIVNFACAFSTYPTYLLAYLPTIAA
jgi:hypothetical protein